MPNPLAALGRKAIVAAAQDIGQTEDGLWLARDMGQPVYYVLDVGPEFGDGAKLRAAERDLANLCIEYLDPQRPIPEITAEVELASKIVVGLRNSCRSVSPGDQVLVQRDLALEYSYQPYTAEERATMDWDDPRQEPLLVATIIEDEVLAVVTPDASSISITRNPPTQKPADRLKAVDDLCLDLSDARMCRDLALRGCLRGNKICRAIVACAAGGSFGYHLTPDEADAVWLGVLAQQMRLEYLAEQNITLAVRPARTWSPPDENSERYAQGARVAAWAMRGGAV